MFPSRVSTDPRVAQGLPVLLAEMDAGGIDTPRRMAAFLATVAHESAFEYDVKQHGSTLGTRAGATSS